MIEPKDVTDATATVVLFLAAVASIRILYLGGLTKELTNEQSRELLKLTSVAVGALVVLVFWIAWRGELL